MRTFTRAMRRLPLYTLLIGSNVGLLLLTVAGLVWIATGLLWQLADDQALGRVMQASTGARMILERSSSDLQSVARLLSERPTLQRLLEANDTAALATFLEQFRQTSQLDGCGIVRNGRVVVQTGIPLSEEVTPLLSDAQPSALLVKHAEFSVLASGSWAAVSTSPENRVVVLRLLNEHFTQRLSAEIGLPTMILLAPTGNSGITDEQKSLYDYVMRTRQPAARRLNKPDGIVAVAPLTTTTGSLAGLIEVALPTTSITHSLYQLVQTLIFLALGMAFVAAGLNFALGRWLIRPLYALTKSAARIGQGDLTTPVPRISGSEIGTLASTLEEMRHHLLYVLADLHRQQAESEAILTGIVEGVFSVDQERRIRFLNPQASAMLQITPEEGLGRFCGDVLNPRRVAGVRPCDEQCPILHARFQQGAHATEHLVLPNGQERTVIITSAPLTEGVQVQVLRDETDEETGGRLRDAILAHISHEFRTPLSAQLASIDLLLDQLPDLTTDQIAHLVQTLQRSTLRLTHLIDNLLESARIEAGHASLRCAAVHLDEVIESALELIRPLLDQNEQLVIMDLPYPIPAIIGDAPRLIQVFVNLLANAHKFAPSRSQIHIGGAVAETTVTLWVADQGPGLPGLHGTELFQRFVRSPTDEPAQSGVGLGLWISKSIIDRHNGWIEAQSSPDGTRMCVTLPVERSNENSRCG